MMWCFSSYPAFFQNVCSSISVRSREETQQLLSLLQLQDFSLLLEGELKQKTCTSVGRVLKLCGHKVDLILTPTKISTEGVCVLFKQTSQLHSLRYSVFYLLVKNVNHLTALVVINVIL